MKQTETLSHAPSTLANKAGQLYVRKTAGESPGIFREELPWFYSPVNAQF